jgi:hypothetical protein
MPSLTPEERLSLLKRAWELEVVNHDYKQEKCKSCKSKYSKSCKCAEKKFYEQTPDEYLYKFRYTQINKNKQSYAYN